MCKDKIIYKISGYLPYSSKNHLLKFEVRIQKSDVRIQESGEKLKVKDKRTKRKDKAGVVGLISD